VENLGRTPKFYILELEGIILINNQFWKRSINHTLEVIGISKAGNQKSNLKQIATIVGQL
jgi:hypothetical protein